MVTALDQRRLFSFGVIRFSQGYRAINTPRYSV
jgi:hypothetical protein